MSGGNSDGDGSNNSDFFHFDSDGAEDYSRKLAELAYSFTQTGQQAGWEQAQGAHPLEVAEACQAGAQHWASTMHLISSDQCVGGYDAHDCAYYCYGRSGRCEE